MQLQNQIILILMRNSTKRQTENKGKQAFRYEKNIQNSTRLSLPCEQRTIPFNLTLFCTKFLQVFEHFKKAIVNVESLS